MLRRTAWSQLHPLVKVAVSLSSLALVHPGAHSCLIEMSVSNCRVSLLFTGLHPPLGHL
jgi:hypothetical protein